MEMIQLIWVPEGSETQCSWTVSCEIGVAAWVVHVQQAANKKKLETNVPMEDSWSRKRVSGNALTQRDFTIGGFQFIHEKSWHDNCSGTGLDYRCVRSMFKIRVAKRTVAQQMFGLKNWQPLWTCAQQPCRPSGSGKQSKPRAPDTKKHGTGHI